MTVVANNPPSQPCIKHLCSDAVLGIEHSVQDRMHGFHFARTTQGLVVVQVMVCGVKVDSANPHIWQVLSSSLLSMDNSRQARHWQACRLETGSQLITIDFTPRIQQFLAILRNNKLSGEVQVK